MKGQNYDLKKVTFLQQVITHQPTLETTLPVVPNKRGRKQLTILPSTANKRAFRQRRQNYIRTLEAKVDNFQLLYTEAQNDVKFLQERLTLLERKLAQRHHNGDNISCNTRPINTSDDVMDNTTCDGNQTLFSITPSSFSSNDQSQIIFDNSAKSVESQSRGRKSLLTSPASKKHMNLTIQRCQRHEKAKAIVCEMLCSETQNEIKMLREKLVSLERSLYNVNQVSRPGNQLLSEITTPTTMLSFSFNDQQQITTCNSFSQTMLANSLRKPLQTIPLPIDNSSHEFIKQWQLQEEESSLLTTTIHPLNLKWILNNNMNNDTN